MSIEIVFENGSFKVGYDSEKRIRPGRGASVLSLLENYVSLDLETTGFSPEYCEIIEIACIRYRNGVEVDSFSSLVKPNDIDSVEDHITKLTGITPNMLQSAPTIDVVFPQALSFIGDDIIVAHKASFDINFMYDNMERLGLGVFGNDYIDTMRMSRRLFPDFVNHKLKTLVKQFHISDDVAHRSESDARQAARCYQYMVQYTVEHSLYEKLSYGGKHGSNVRSSDIVGNPELLRENSPLYGKTIVFTGALDRMTRKEAMQIVADLGGINGDTVTKKTDYLVIGNNDMCASIKGGKSSKQKKAEKYILAGFDLAIISENVFYDMLSENSKDSDVVPVSPTPVSISESAPAPALIHCSNTEPSGVELDFIARLSSILQNHPAYNNLVIERRSDSYLSVVLGSNDFLRFKYSSRTKWISLDLPKDVATANVDNPIFSAQKNKAQRHWKAALSSLDDVDQMADLIVSSCREG